ncbi:MAG TPA: hypothetical protein VMF03_17425, partial [Steroidobacteraceae bacterium]|nr:hypothetical protein [Steroidobacteraceae bacterium]
NSDFRAGDTLQFRILRTGAADAHGAGTMRLVLPIPDGPAEEREPTQTSAVTQSAAVERVLRWEDGNDRGIAYLVRWHDVPVAVMDELAATSFAPGERIEFSVVQADDASGKHLDFMMFAFPRTSPGSRP